MQYKHVYTWDMMRKKWHNQLEQPMLASCFKMWIRNNKFIQHDPTWSNIYIARMIGGNQQDPGMGYCIRLSLQQQLMITPKKDRPGEPVDYLLLVSNIWLLGVLSLQASMNVKTLGALGLGSSRCRIYTMLCLSNRGKMTRLPAIPTSRDEGLVMFWCCYPWKQCAMITMW